ncbi:serine protease snake-like [Malaya genurostris]|uniref:serine protease snake-like n=1 Tax=Malaya genurostris TaxID=325434 RepID=UPI0026F3FF5C|nr:serine protease snake-like [Malaya genurostris]
MILILSSFVSLLLLPVIRGQRISEQKCIEYRTANMMVEDTLHCQQTKSLILLPETFAGQREFPHHTLIGWRSDNPGVKYEFLCSGALISDRFVLTAAHCGYSTSSGTPVVVRLGGHNRQDELDNHVEDMDIEQFIKHPQYSARYAYHDIALVKLKDRVSFSNVIRPACLWAEQNMNFTSATAIGFQLTEYGSKSSYVLQKENLDVVFNAKCEMFYNGSRKFPTGLSEQQYCMTSTGNRKDNCQGYSGGPVQVLTDAQNCIYHVIAFTSFGLICGAGNAPTVYSNVPSYIDWIEETVWG